jgi:uncharacterized protein YkwD
MTRERPITHAMKRRSTVPFLAAACAIACAAGPAPAGAARHHDRVERSVIRKINFIRSGYGLPHVRPLTALRHAAEEHSRDMARTNFFDHPSSDGTPFDVRVRRYVGGRAVGETLAALSGGSMAARVVSMWMNSPPHRAILLERRFHRIGVARHRGGLGMLFTADFAGRR